MLVRGDSGWEFRGERRARADGDPRRAPRHHRAASRASDAGRAPCARGRQRGRAGVRRARRGRRRAAGQRPRRRRGRRAALRRAGATPGARCARAARAPRPTAPRARATPSGTRSTSRCSIRASRPRSAGACTSGSASGWRRATPGARKKSRARSRRTSSAAATSSARSATTARRRRRRGRALPIQETRLHVEAALRLMRERTGDDGGDAAAGADARRPGLGVRRPPGAGATREPHARSPGCESSPSVSTVPKRASRRWRASSPSTRCAPSMRSRVERGEEMLLLAEAGREPDGGRGRPACRWARCSTSASSGRRAVMASTYARSPMRRRSVCRPSSASRAAVFLRRSTPMSAVPLGPGR